jgi:XTP/dITP diphosphohydrolase
LLTTADRRLVTVVLIATTNPDKLREIRPLLDGLSIDLTTLAAWPDLVAPEETGTTFLENARAKALYYARATSQLTVAEDSGLEIDALDGAPGVHSARFGGVATPYPEKFRMIYEALRATSKTTSAARFVCTLALVRDENVLFETRGFVSGMIAPAPAGRGGFGYDPIFYYPPFGQTLAEAGDRKASVSHRGEAFRALRAFLVDRGRTEVLPYE